MNEILTYFTPPFGFFTNGAYICSGHRKSYSYMRIKHIRSVKCS